MARWFDKAAEQLEEDLDSGAISDEDFRREMRELREEFRSEAHEAAEQAYHDHTGF